MRKNLSSENWKVRPLTTATGAAALGVGICFLEFMNVDSGETTPVGFFGAAFGVGLKASGTLGQWAVLTVDRPFSISELDYAEGRITTLGAGLAIGGSWTYITAWKDYKTSAWSLLTSDDRVGDIKNIVEERTSRFVGSRLPMPSSSRRLRRSTPSVDLLFSSCPVGGLEAGSGAGGSVIRGVWKLL
jgi:hypothetical protein